MTAIRVQGRDDVLTVMRSKREALGITHLEMDERVGLGSGHYGKLERMGAAWGKQGLRMSPSVMNSLDALGLEIVIAPKGEIPAEARPRDVRMIPEPPTPSNVVRLVTGPVAAQPSGWFGNWMQERYALAAKAKKKPAGRRAQRAQVGGATC